MATRTQVVRAIRERITAAYTGSLPLLLDLNDATPGPLTGYVRLQVNWGRHTQDTSGSPALWVSDCSAAMTVAVPADSGEGTLLEQLDILSSVFSGVVLLGGDVEFSSEQPVASNEARPELAAASHIWHFTWREWRHHNPAFEAPLAMEAVTERVTTASAHGFSRGQLVYQNSGAASGWSLARADAESTMAAAIVSAVHASTVFDAVPLGLVYLPGHGLGAKATGLFTSDATAGLLTATAPTTTNHWRQKVGEVWDAHNVLFLREPAVRL